MDKRRVWMASARVAALCAGAWVAASAAGCSSGDDANTSNGLGAQSPASGGGGFGGGIAPGGAGGSDGMAPAMVGNDATGSGPAAGAGGLAGMGMTAGAGGGDASGGAGQMAAAGAGGAGMAGTGTMDMGEAGAGGDMMMGEAGSGGSGEPPAQHEDLGEGDGRDVITIGDSWMNLLIAGIAPSLGKVSGRMYRDYSFPGTLVLNEQIPGQYETAKMEDADIKTVVMTGGGNDILTTSCADEECNSIVDDVSDRLFQLMTEMGQDGVEDVVLIGYTYPDDTSKRESLDYSRMISSMQCTTDTMPRCHYLDSTMLDLTLRDGIHPDDAGYDLIASTVWQMMQDEGMRR